MSKNGNDKNIVLVVVALIVFLIGIYFAKTLSKDNLSFPNVKKAQTSLDDDTVKAKEALEKYYEYLSSHQYDDAQKLHGSRYEYMIVLNPDVDRNDEALLLEQACDFNGFLCMPVHSVVSSEKLSDNEYEFIIHFMDGNGEIFIPREIKDPVVADEFSTHTFRVTESSDKYFVTTPLIFYP